MAVLAQSVMPNDVGECQTAEFRKTGSKILESEIIGETPQQDQTRYVEVPVIEDHVSYVKVPEIRERERQVPGQIITQYRERIVDNPVIQYIDRPNPVEQVQEVVHEVQVPRTICRNIDVVIEKHIPRVRVIEEKKIVQKFVEVEREVFEDREVEVERLVDREVPVIVCQTVKPVITQSDRALVVDVMDCEPEVIPVDIHVAKPVQSALEAVGKIGVRHRIISISAAQYNTILRMLNSHLVPSRLPFVRENDRVPFLDESATPFKIAPNDIDIEGVTRAPAPSQIPRQMTQQASQRMPSRLTQQPVAHRQPSQHPPTSYRGHSGAPRAHHQEDERSSNIGSRAHHDYRHPQDPHQPPHDQDHPSRGGRIHSRTDQSKTNQHSRTDNHSQTGPRHHSHAGEPDYQHTEPRNSSRVHPRHHSHARSRGPSQVSHHGPLSDRRHLHHHPQKGNQACC